MSKQPLPENTDIFHALFEKSADAILLLENGIFTDCNQAAVKLMHAKDKQQILSLHPSMLSPESQPDGRPSREKADEMIQIAITEGSHRFEWTHRRTDGQDFPAEVLLTPITVNDRKIIQAVVRDLTQFYSTIENALDAVISINQEGRIIEWNPQAEKITGWSRVDVLGKNLEETIIPSIHTQGHVQGMQHYHATGEGPILNKRIEIIAQRRNGEIFPVELSVIPIKTEQETIFTAFMREITEQKRSEEQLRQNQQFLQSVIDHIPQAIFWKDKDLRYLGANKSFARDAGLADPQEMIGKSDFDMPWRERAHLYREDDQRVMQTGEIKLNFEEPLITAEGKRTWLRTSKLPLRNLEGEIVSVLGIYADITNQKQAEERLRQSEARFRAIFDAANDAIFLMDGANPVIVECNQRTASMFGATMEEVIGKTPMFFSPETQPGGKTEETIGGFIQDVLAGQGRVFEWQHKRLDGSLFDAEVSLSALRIGEQVYVQSIVRDITERKQAEEKLRESEERYHRLSEATVDAIVIHDKGILVDANQNFARMFGYDLSDVIGMNALDFLTPETRQITAENIRQGNEKPYDVMGLRKDGSTFPVEITGKAIYYEGQPMRVTALRDITERKQAEQALIESETRYRNAIAAAGAVPYYIEYGAETYRFMGAGIEELTGYSHEELSPTLLGQIIQETVITGKNSGLGREEAIAKTRAGQSQEWRADYRLTDKNGVTRWVSDASVQVLGENGKPIGAIGVLQDITERKNLEQENIERQRFLQSVIDHIPQAIFWKDKDLRYLGANKNFAQDAGFADPQEMVGKSDFDMPWREHAHLYRQDDLRVFETGEVKLDFEEPLITAEGKRTWLRTSKLPLRNLEGEIVSVLGLYSDVTNQKQAEEQLRQSETRFRAIFEAANDAIFLMDGPTIISCNERTAIMFGATTKEQVVGQTPVLFSPETQPDGQNSEEKAAKLIELVLAGQSQVFEWKHKRLDGSLFDAEVSFNRVQTADEIYLQAIVRDITEQKRNAEAIRQSQSKLAQLIETSPLGIIEWNINFEVVAWNPAAERIFGFSADEARGRHAAGLVIPAEIKPIVDKVWSDLISQTGGTQSINDNITKDGRIITCEWLNTPLVGADGKVFGASSVVQDVTERKRAEDELQKRIQVETLLTTISSSFITSTADDLDEKITQSLKTLCAFAIADRSYLFLIDENDEFMSNTHEWCADGIQSHIQELQGVSVDSFPWLMKKLKKAEVVDIPLIAELPAEAKAEKQEFQKEGIQSLVVVPIVYQQKLAGFMGFDAVTQQRNWEQETITVLRTVGETFIATIERANLEKAAQATLQLRSYQVQTSTQIAQEIASAPALGDLFERVVTLTKERFGYYHTQLLQYEAAQDAVVLIKGYGAIGQQMLNLGHKLPLGQGLIGTAAASGKTVLRPNLAEDPDWQPNPLLPETRGEIAVPIKMGDAILGVLDVQSSGSNALSIDDQILLEGLCGQIAIAIESTRLRAEMNESIEETSRLYRAMSREGWQAFRQAGALPTGFIFDRTGVIPIEEEEQSLLEEKTPTAAVSITVPGGESVGTLEVAEDPERPFSEEDQLFLQQIAEQVALALESARLFEQTQAALTQNEKLSAASLRFAQATDLQELVQIVVQTLGIPNINRAVLEGFSMNQANEIESMTALGNWWNGTGIQPTPIGTTLSAGVMHTIQLFAASEPVFFNDTLNDPRMDAASLEFLRQRNIRALAVLPLFLGTRQIGALLLEAEEPYRFSTDEVRLFTAMGPQIATVLENRRQFERAQKQAERETMLNIIGQKIQGATSVEAVLQIAARELGRAIGAQRTIAQLSLKDQK